MYLAEIGANVNSYMEKEYNIKKDKYTEARGGTSKVLDIYCEKCDTKLLQYQKDGPGILKRFYMDRIISPDNLVNLHKQDIDQVEKIVCPNCERMIAVPYIYDTENRKSFRIFVDAIKKDILYTG